MSSDFDAQRRIRIELLDDQLDRQLAPIYSDIDRMMSTKVWFKSYGTAKVLAFGGLD
jgi:hypothetical protein